jgi:hypothetical protein
VSAFKVVVVVSGHRGDQLVLVARRRRRDRRATYPVDTERVDDVMPDGVRRIETSTFEPGRVNVTSRASGEGAC